MSSMPERIGRYEPTDMLGEGAMAAVYRAFDPEIDRELAIKVLHAEHSSDPEYRFRFLREAKAAGSLTHQNIVTIYDVGEAEDHPYIAMELLEGPTLDKVMSTEGAFPVQSVIRIGMQLAEALDYAHSRGIVHRDIKPSNIVYLEDKNAIKITDFGIAHLEDLTRTHKTQIGTVLGTPQYMSPEQVNGESVDGRSDLFSVGIVLYQLLSGQRPFSADTITKLMIQIVQEDPTPLKQLVPSLHTPLAKIVEKLLRKDPNRRFQTGRELIDALRPVLRHAWDKEHREAESKLIPLHIRWAVFMAAIVAVVMIIGGYLVYKKQAESMTRLVLNYGSSLARFVAMESAEPILVKDWVAIETFVQETNRNQELAVLVIVDFEGIIRGSTDESMLGQAYGQVGDIAYLDEINRTKVYEGSAGGRGEAFYFDAPVLFQDRQIGRVYLGLPQSSLQKVARLTIFMMIVLMLVTVTAVAVVGFVLAKRLSKPMAVLKSGLLEIKQGIYSHRIEEERNDEFGQLFAAFDEMAASVQDVIEDESSEAKQQQLSANGSGQTETENVGTNDADKQTTATTAKAE